MSVNLTAFGFGLERAGLHTRRTMMYDDLERLLECSDLQELKPHDYKALIVDENCLGKISAKTRTLTYQYLVDMYLLNPDILLFRALHYYWVRDVSARPQLAMLCAYNRDSLIRMVAPFILSLLEGSILEKTDVEEFITSQQPERFSQSTLESTVRNLNASFTRSGHLQGHTKKIRTKIEATPASVAYALLLGQLRGLRGESLLNSEYMRLLECSYEHGLELASDAARNGWLVFKRVGDVIEVAFPNLITKHEMELLNEQN